METRAGDPGAFARFDLNRVDTPSFVVDAAALRRNLSILADIGERSGAKILSAMKAFSMWEVAPLIGQYLNGVCTSGLWEARLANEKYSGKIATYCAGYKAEDLPEILDISDHVIFNSPGQYQRFLPIMKESKAKFDVGLRINPEHREGEVEKYDPCQPCSRLGFPLSQLCEEHLEGISGLHFHTLCEQDFQPLQRTWEEVSKIIRPWFGRLKWINLGGGHHITRADYQRDELVRFLVEIADESGCQIYLEPGEAVALDAGILVGQLLDIFDNGMPVGITDISATCHMPDVIEAPYRPAMLGEKTDDTPAVRLGGPSCLAGDIIGDYRLPCPPEPGRRFAFLDQAHYSMVKTNSFNGVPLPSIWLWDSDTDELRQIRRFDWTEFRNRLS